MTGLSEKRELFEFARFIFNSDAYILLHRAARFTLVKFILTIMIDLACPLGFTPQIQSENYNPFAPKELDAKDFFKLLKGFIHGSDEDLEERKANMKALVDYETQQRNKRAFKIEAENYDSFDDPAYLAAKASSKNMLNSESSNQSNPNLDETKLSKTELKKIEREKAEAKELLEMRLKLDEIHEVKDELKVEAQRNRRKLE